MNENRIDHSEQVESRLKAITIEKQDYCVFFKDKSGGASINHDCFSCFWSSFGENVSIGLCKYKK